MDYYPSPALPLPPGSLAQNGAEFELVHHFCTVTVDTLSLREVSKQASNFPQGIPFSVSYLPTCSSKVQNYLPTYSGGKYFGERKERDSRKNHHIYLHLTQFHYFKTASVKEALANPKRVSSLCLYRTCDKSGEQSYRAKATSTGSCETESWPPRRCTGRSSCRRTRRGDGRTRTWRRIIKRRDFRGSGAPWRTSRPITGARCSASPCS